MTPKMTLIRRPNKDDATQGALDNWRHEVAATAIALAREVRCKIENGEEIPFSTIAASKTYIEQCIESEALLRPLDAKRLDAET